jgi:hypothetical protein
VVGVLEVMADRRTPLQKALRKRANALRSVVTAERAVARWRARVAELDAEIASYGGRKQAPLPLRLPFRANGEVERTMFDLLRKRREITTADLAARLMVTFGLDASDEHTAWAMRQRAAQAFKRCEKKGVVKWVGGAGKGGSFKRWTLA